MVKSEILAIRNTIGDDSKLRIFADNAVIIDALSDNTELIWDDTNELLHIIRPNTTDFYNQKTVPVKIEVCDYDVIQYISVRTDYDGLETYIGKLLASNTIDQARYNEILNTLKK